MRPRLPAICFLFAALSGPALAAETSADCRLGIYRMADGSDVDIAKSEGKTLRWRRPDGTSGQLAEKEGEWTSTLGWTGRPDGHRVAFSSCEAGQVRFDGATGQRIPLVVKGTRFQGDGVSLVGRLVLPPGDGPVPIVVLLHGSEDDGAVASNSLQRRLPAQGVGAFVYDKRGTGDSGGRYTQDFQLLARDAVAALKEARRLAGARAGRVGFQGPSQGGWVAPIAAHQVAADFVIVGFGLAVSVLDEDREALVMNLQAKGHGEAAMAQAMKFADAAHELAQHPTREEFDRFLIVRDRYRGEPWFKDAHGNFIFALKELDAKAFEANVWLLKRGTPWTYDPSSTIATLNVPQLWMLAADDVDAPAAETARRLERLRQHGRPISVAVFPRTEHGVFEFETQADGKRLSTRQPSGYLPMLVDFARGDALQSSYGGVKASRPLK